VFAVVVLWPGLWIRADLAAQESQEPSPDQDPPVLVEGAVLDYDTGDPIPGATISLGAGPSGSQGRGTRVSDDEGRFRFRQVPAGTYRLSVSSQDFGEMTDTLEVSGERDLDLILPLPRDADEFEVVILPPPRPSSDRRGFEARRRSGGGFVVTRQDIRRRQPRYLTELLHQVPGGMVVPAGRDGYTLLLRNQCRPGIWLDGVRLGGANSIDRLLSPQDAEAVEVYHGFELPAEFGVDACGGVLLWTRRGDPTATGAGSGGGILGPLVQVVALVATLLVLAR
jgi:hypothetical protein